jgi:hypothetical protein
MNNDIINKSINKAMYGGISGFSAMTIQVSSLMWLRTIMNYQYKNGGTLPKTFKTLYGEGGLKRFYRGYPYAIMLGPISRFGDTAANAFMTDYFKNSSTPIYIQTLYGSVVSSAWRINLMPLDTLKTTLQVDGKSGMTNLRHRIKTQGLKTLYNGTSASLTANMVGHYPWFLTYNYLNANLDNYNDNPLKKLIRNGSIGFASAIISDCCSNSFRILKTSSQTNINNESYRKMVSSIIEKDGYKGLFGRGLKTRILTNGLQGILFNITWKYIESKLV